MSKNRFYFHYLHFQNNNENLAFVAGSAHFVKLRADGVMDCSGNSS